MHDGVEVNFVPMRALETEGGGVVRPEMRPYGAVKKGYKSFLSGDVIMAKITPCMENGKMAVVPKLRGGVCFGSTEFHVIRPEYGIEPRWIANFLLQHEVRRAALRQMAGGVGQMRVPAAFLEATRMPVPPANEQIHISDAIDELFSDLDAGVAALERVREKLKLYRASILKAAVEGAVTAEWRAQHPHTEPASELLQRILVERRRRWEEDQLARFKAKGQEPPQNWMAKYKEPAAFDTTSLPPLPERWSWCSGDTLFNFITSGSRGWARYCADEGALFIRMGNLDHGLIRLDLEETQRVKPPADSEGMRTRVEARDILISITADVGMIALVPDDIEEAYINQHVALARPVLPALGAFVAWYMASPSGGQLRLKDLQHGATKVGLGLDDIRNVAIPLPPLSEQEAIVEAIEDQLSVVDHLAADLNAKRKSAQTLRQAILRHAFAGHLVQQDPNDEPASELLKRIVAERAARACESAAAKRETNPSNQPKTGRRGRSKKNTQGTD
jgi:type I restriction enzyme S subunit